MTSLRDIINQVEQDANRLMAYDGELLGYFIPVAKWREIRAVLTEMEQDDLRKEGRKLASQREDLVASGVDPNSLLIPHDRVCWCGSPVGFREDKGYLDCLTDRSHDWRAKGSKR